MYFFQKSSYCHLRHAWQPNGSFLLRTLLNTYSGYEQTVIPNAVYTTTPINQQTVNSIHNLLGTLGKIDDLCVKTVKAYKEYKSKMNRKQCWVLWPIAFAGITWLFLILVNLDFYDATISGDFSEWCGEILGTYFIAVLISALIGCIPAVLSIHFISSSANYYRDKAITYLKAIDLAYSQININELQLLPPIYRHYDAAMYIYACFMNQRAVTMQQAVNLYDYEPGKRRIHEEVWNNRQQILMMLNSASFSDCKLQINNIGLLFQNLG